MTNELAKRANEEKEARAEAPIKSDDPGVQPTATGLIDKGSAVAERIEKALAREEALQTRKEEFYAKQQLAGRAQAGQEIVEKTQEQIDQETADAMVSAFR